MPRTWPLFLGVVEGKEVDAHAALTYSVLPWVLLAYSTLRRWTRPTPASSVRLRRAP